MAVTISGSTPTFSSGYAGGTITRGTAQTLSGTSINYTSIPSWVKRITVMFSGASTNGTSDYLIQIGTGGTPTTSGYNSLSTGSGGSSFTTGATNGFNIKNYSGASTVFFGSVTITNLNGNIWVASGVTECSPVTVMNAGGVTISATLDMVRITTVNGTDSYDAGTVNILYE